MMQQPVSQALELAENVSSGLQMYMTGEAGDKSMRGSDLPSHHDSDSDAESDSTGRIMLRLSVGQD